MDPLRIVLVLIGALIVAGIAFFEIRKRRSANNASQLSERTEPTLSFEDEEGILDDVGVSSEQIESDAENHSEIVMLSITARNDDSFEGTELVEAAEEAGLHYGAWNIFHYHTHDDEGRTKPVFSMANITEPGFFDISKITSFSTQGVTLFMQLPGPLAAMDAFDEMLSAGNAMADRLDGVLQDEQHKELTPTNIEHIKEKILNFNISVH